MNLYLWIALLVVLLGVLIFYMRRNPKSQTNVTEYTGVAIRSEAVNRKINLHKIEPFYKTTYEITKDGQTIRIADMEYTKNAIPLGTKKIFLLNTDTNKECPNEDVYKRTIYRICFCMLAILVLIVTKLL